MRKLTDFACYDRQTGQFLPFELTLNRRTACVSGVASPQFEREDDEYSVSEDGETLNPRDSCRLKLSQIVDIWADNDYESWLDSDYEEDT